MEDWRKLDELHSGCTFIPVVSELAEDWPGETGLITDAMNRHMKQLDAQQTDVYLAGPPAMIQAVTQQLIDKNVPQQQIYSDMYCPSPKAQSKRPIASVARVHPITSGYLDNQTNTLGGPKT